MGWSHNGRTGSSTPEAFPELAGVYAAAQRGEGTAPGVDTYETAKMRAEVQVIAGTNWSTSADRLVRG
jgi:hypothetical protein